MEKERLLGVMVHSELHDCLYLQFHEVIDLKNKLAARYFACRAVH